VGRRGDRRRGGGVAVVVVGEGARLRSGRDGARQRVQGGEGRGGCVGRMEKGGDVGG